VDKYDWQLNRFIALNLNVPLFTGFANKNQYQSAKISQNIAQMNYEEAKRKSSLNDMILINNFITSKQSVQTSQQNMELAKENVQFAFNNYSDVIKKRIDFKIENEKISNKF
jgi:outer membrane protein TolC